MALKCKAKAALGNNEETQRKEITQNMRALEKIIAKYGGGGHTE